MQQRHIACAAISHLVSLAQQSGKLELRRRAVTHVQESRICQAGPQYEPIASMGCTASFLPMSLSQTPRHDRCWHRKICSFKMTRPTKMPENLSPTAFYSTTFKDSRSSLSRAFAGLVFHMVLIDVDKGGSISNNSPMFRAAWPHKGQ